MIDIQVHTAHLDALYTLGQYRFNFVRKFFCSRDQTLSIKNMLRNGVIDLTTSFAEHLSMQGENDG